MSTFIDHEYVEQLERRCSQLEELLVDQSELRYNNRIYQALTEALVTHLCLEMHNDFDETDKIQEQTRGNCRVFIKNFIDAKKTLILKKTSKLQAACDEFHIAIKENWNKDDYLH